MREIKDIFISFIKDQRGFIATYFINFSLVVLFYTLITKHSVEILYPLSITLFILVIFLIIKWIKYYDFNKKLSKCSGDELIIINPYSEEEKEMNRVIKGLEKHYIDEISNIKSDNLKNNKIISQWIHNMKTPVSVIDLIIQRLKTNKVDINHGIYDIEEENKMLIANLDGVLDILRLEDFSKDYVPESINILTIVKTIINEKKNQFIYNNVYPKIEVEREDITVFTDKKWNKVMIEQLVSNAIKYSAEDGKKKTVTFIITKEMDKVQLVIKDEGIGISDYDLARIFEPFFTGENGRKYRNSSGIGLYICKQISDKLNHEIDIISEVGLGTVVKVNYLSIP